MSVIVTDENQIRRIIADVLEVKYADPYLTEEQAIDYLGVSERYFREIKNELNPIRKSRTVRYYHIEELIKWKSS